MVCTGNTGERYGRARLAAVLALVALLPACSDGSTAPDTDPPSIATVSPADGTIGVSALPRITIQFSEPVDTTGLGSDFFTLHAGAHRYRGRLSVQQRSIEFVPSDALDFGTTYTATLSPGIRDRSGNLLATGHQWTFTTEGRLSPGLDADSMKGHILTLAADSLMGRAAGTNDELRAAQYIGDRFQAWGLDPPGGGYIQPFQAISARSARVISSRNVFAIVPGTGGLADRWVIVGAHYDALGVLSNPDGSIEVLNGADDNASGTALVLELARSFRAYTATGGTGNNGRRSVLFAAFGAEEEGLLGSRHYTRNPTIPPARMSAMLNFDMVGRLRGSQLTAHGVQSSSVWPDMLANANRTGLVMGDATSCQSCSDHAGFRDIGVPYIWFFTGTHSDYHRPADDEALIEYGGMSRIGDLALRTLIRLAVAPG